MKQPKTISTKKKTSNATREGRKDDVLAGHTDNALIFDALPPLKHDTAAEYRQSFDKWWPETSE